MNFNICNFSAYPAIVKGKCDYVLAVKDNHPTMYEEIKEYFALKDTEKECEITKTFDLGHGRIEKRKYILSTAINWFEDKKKREDLKAFGKVENSGTRNGEKYSETRYFLLLCTNLTPKLHGFALFIFLCYHEL